MQKKKRNKNVVLAPLCSGEDFTANSIPMVGAGASGKDKEQGGEGTAFLFYNHPLQRTEFHENYMNFF